MTNACLMMSLHVPVKMTLIRLLALVIIVLHAVRDDISSSASSQILSPLSYDTMVMGRR